MQLPYCVSGSIQEEFFGGDLNLGRGGTPVPRLRQRFGFPSQQPARQSTAVVTDLLVSRIKLGLLGSEMMRVNE